MRYLFLLLTLGCSMHKTSLRGVADVVEDEWITVEVTGANNANTWVKINRRSLKGIREGDKVIFYVKVEEGTVKK